MPRGLPLLIVLSVSGSAAAQPSSGALLLQSGTTGALVVVDGAPVGTVPLPGPVERLAPGDHTLKVARAGFAPYFDVFTVESGAPTTVSVDLLPVAGVLAVSANVARARVYVDGKYVGLAPLQTELPVGVRAIQVSRSGYQDFFRNVSSIAGEEVRLAVRLAELPTSRSFQSAAPRAKWYDHWWVWSLGAVGVGVVVTAVVVPAYYVTRDPIVEFCKGGCPGGVIGVSLP